MRITIIQLSDIHISADNDPILGRAKKIAAAVKSNSTDTKAYLVVITGDIAFSGQKAQYKLALNFLSELKRELSSDSQEIIVRCILVPGNHDCDLTNDQDKLDVRNALLEQLAEDVTKISTENGRVKTCLSVQNNFFSFLSTIEPELSYPESPKLFYTINVPVDGQVIKFNCYNTAWLSQINEKQGQLVFPVNILAAGEQSSAGASHLVVSLFHHPYNWLEPSNSLDFRQQIERTSDIILTGHEHTENFYQKKVITGEEIQYTEGAVLQEHGKERSAFNLLIVDLEKQQQRVIQYEWRNSLYTQRHITNWITFTRNNFLMKQGFFNELGFASWLQDPGTAFLHPYKKTVLLRDLFVYPDLVNFSIKRKLEGKSPSKTIKGGQLIEHVLKTKSIIIYGSSLSGKTNLAKVFYSDLRKHEIVPLLINGGVLKGSDEESLRKAMRKAFAEQYSDTLLEQYQQLDPKQRALIIDDFHLFALNQTAKQQLLELAQKIFDYVIVLAGDIYRLQQLVGQGKDQFTFTFDHYEIKEFGHSLRGQLIRKWTRLGRELTATPESLVFEEDRKEKVVRTALGRNVLPAHPLTILMVLQLWDTNQSANSGSGSYGYLYEELITSRLRAVSSKATEVDRKYTIISRIAHFFFETEQEEVTNDEMREIVDRYFKDYKVNVDLRQLLEELEQARILERLENGYRFTYPYIYYYFVARYIKENLSGRENVRKLRSQVMEMIERVTYEPYSNILLFLVYLTKDRRFIEKLIEQSKQIYKGYAPAELDEDVAFLNQIQRQPRSLQLPESDATENRDSYWEEMDAVDAVESEGDDTPTMSVPKSTGLVKYSDDLDDLTKITIAFKNLDLLGQILRNFPGSLRADLKLELAEECYMLGLRTLRALLSSAEEKLDELRIIYSKLIKDRRAIRSDIDLLQATDSIMIWLANGACYGIIKRVSYSIGHEDLKEIYKDVVRRRGGIPSVDLIDLSLKLDHFPEIPLSQIKHIEKKVEKNKFVWELLRDMIANHLYLFHVKEQTRQQLCAKFNISTGPSNNLKQLYNEHKRPRQ